MSETRLRNRPGGSGIARHGRLNQSHATVTVLKFLATALAVVVVSVASVAGIAVSQLKGNVKTVHLVGETQGTPPDLGSFEGGFNVLIVGSDSRAGSGEKGPTSELNDVTMLVHVAQDQTNAVVVSIPRDMVVPIPACPKLDGKGNYGAMAAQPINNTLTYGGLACTVVTVKALTGLDIPFAGLIQFQGVAQMADAAGGVDICVNGPFHDSYTGLRFPAAGTYTISGNDAQLFLRSRHGVGDGSDLGRISSQQVFLSSLVRKIKSDGTLANPGRLFALATAATKNMKLSTNLTNLTTMVSMALVLKNIPLDRIAFVQYPGTTGVGGVYQGKVAPLTQVATALFAKIKADQPFTLDSGTGRGSVAAPSASPTTAATPAPSGSPSAAAAGDAAEVLPGVLGQTAADHTCSKVNK